MFGLSVVLGINSLLSTALSHRRVDSYGNVLVGRNFKREDAGSKGIPFKN